MTATLETITPADLSGLEITPMSQAHAREVAEWSYPGEYAFYDYAADPDDLAELLDAGARKGQYFSATLPAVGLIGFVQLKPSPGDDVEIGLGLHPRCAGRGLGVRFVTHLCRWVAAREPAAAITLLVAGFNRRAITVYERAGFVADGVADVELGGRTVHFITMTLRGSGSAC